MMLPWCRVKLRLVRFVTDYVLACFREISEISVLLILFPIIVRHMQLVAVKVVAIAVRTVMRMLRILPQRELLLKVPIVLKVKEWPPPTPPEGRESFTTIERTLLKVYNLVS